MSGRHPAIDFDLALRISQEVEVRLYGIETPFRGRIIRLGKITARVEALEAVGDWRPGHVFVVPRWNSPLWTEHYGMFPARREDEAASQPGIKPDIVSRLMDYEQGTMNEKQTVELFQELIDSGTVWHLQGSYGRMAARLIEAGYCHNKGV